MSDELLDHFRGFWIEESQILIFMGADEIFAELRVFDLVGLGTCLSGAVSYLALGLLLNIQISTV